jgi:CHAD domain-containing protein
VRDWDVFLATLTEEEHKKKRRHQPGVDFLLGHALGQRVVSQVRLAEMSATYPFAFERLMVDTVAAIQKPRNDHGVRVLLDLAGPQILSLARDLDQAAACDLSDYEHLHRVRIVGKRLRYAMEIFADCFAAPFREKLYPAVEEMQEILGRANDCHVAAQRLRALGERIRTLLPREWKRLRPGIEGQLKFHQQRLPAERRRFEKWWQRWQRLGGGAAFTALLKSCEPAAS